MSKYYLYLQTTDSQNRDLYQDYFADEQLWKLRGDSGIDIRFPQTMILNPQSVHKIDLGVKAKVFRGKPLFEHPSKYVNASSVYHRSPFWLAPRSSICKTPLLMKNSLGLIDAEYQGNLIVYVYHHGTEPFEIKKGTSLFQIVVPSLEPVEDVIVLEAQDVLFPEKSLRADGGFGSTNSSSL